jgi:hypothetical protein
MSPHISSCTAPRRRWLPLAFAGAAALALGGCMDDLSLFSGFGCKRVKSTELHVAQDATCKFRYSQGDAALYVVKVLSEPMYGSASGKGKYLHYVAKQGFVGTDHVRIRVFRRGIGHVQWQDYAVTVKVGSKA